jgi:hypothetical protein
MADIGGSPGAPPSSYPSSLCSHCWQMFQGHHHPGSYRTLRTAPWMSEIKPDTCRICSYIQARFERCGGRYGGQQLEKIESPGIKYRFNYTGDGSATTLDLDLTLDFDFPLGSPRETRIIEFTLVPTNCKRLISITCRTFR